MGLIIFAEPEGGIKKLVFLVKDKKLLLIPKLIPRK
jgi:hypothetical protein